MKKIKNWLKCLFAGHDWTCAANEGIKPTTLQLESSHGFHDFSTMYCKRCKTISTLHR